MIFLDTNFIIAYSVKRHDNNSRAEEIWKDIENEDKAISKVVFVEVFNVLNVQLKENIELSNKVRDFILDKLLILNDHKYHDKAFKLMSEFYHDSKRVQFADCVYIALMKELGIKQIATFDNHFNSVEGIERIH